MPRKRKVIEIARKASISRREAAGTLLEFWIWADQNADAAGNLPRLTLADLNEAVPASPMFWKAVMDAGWLADGDDGLRIPNAAKWLSKAKLKAKTKGEPIDSSPVAMTFDCAGQPERWDLHTAQIATWQTQFQRLDVREECNNALGHTKTKAMKTAKGMRRFLYSWLMRSNDRLKTNGQKPLISRVPSDDDLKDWRP